jgi:hypothetical protein
MAVSKSIRRTCIFGTLRDRVELSLKRGNVTDDSAKTLSMKLQPRMSNVFNGTFEMHVVDEDVCPTDVTM